MLAAFIITLIAIMMKAVRTSEMSFYFNEKGLCLILPLPGSE
jgi:hypothetical protein